MCKNNCCRLGKLKNDAEMGHEGKTGSKLLEKKTIYNLSPSLDQTYNIQIDKNTFKVRHHTCTLIMTSWDSLQVTFHPMNCRLCYPRALPLILKGSYDLELKRSRLFFKFPFIHTMLSTLALNSWSQVILLIQPPRC
jgi:hypothetical protein